MRFRTAVLCLFAALTLAAQTPPAGKSAQPAKAPPAPKTAPAADAWKTATTLPDIDLSDLTAVQKGAVFKLLREEDCSCQCGMKTAECLMKDSHCSYSRTLARIAIQGVKDGK